MKRCSVPLYATNILYLIVFDFDYANNWETSISPSCASQVYRLCTINSSKQHTQITRIFISSFRVAPCYDRPSCCHDYTVMITSLVIAHIGVGGMKEGDCNVVASLIGGGTTEPLCTYRQLRFRPCSPAKLSMVEDLSEQTFYDWLVCWHDYRVWLRQWLSRTKGCHPGWGERGGFLTYPQLRCQYHLRNRALSRS